MSHYASFRIGAGPIRPGVIHQGKISALPKVVGSLEEFLLLSDDDRAAALEQLRDPLSLANVELVAPLRPKKNVFCVGRNYLGHAEEIARARGTPLDLPDVPTFFTKAPTAIASPEQQLRLPAAYSQQWDWEAELAVVVGERCRDLKEEDALGAVFGYMCLNDMTARDVQKAHVQWFKGKSFDNTCPIGPWIVTADELGDPQDVTVSLRVNGVEKQRASTSTMIFSVARILAILSRGMTLEPGDIIATGTPEGVGLGRTPPEFLKDGDVVEVDIDRIGILRNTVSIA